MTEPNSIATGYRALRFPRHRIDGMAGTSFKHEHLTAILEEDRRHGFFEVHAENYMGEGGPPHRALTRIRQDYPVSIHGVCMSIGGPQPLDRRHLARFRALVERYEPALVSEHLAWSTHESTYFNDLLPLPYTADTLQHVADHIDEVQETIGRQILLENPSSYLTFTESTMTETAFLRALVRSTGCGLLLDVSNVFVSATNHGFSADAYLADFPFEHVGEIHLAGHAEQRDDEGDPLLIVITADRGLCGSFNSNVIKAAGQFIVAEGTAHEIALGLIGRKGRDFFRRRGFDIRYEQVNIFARLTFGDAVEVAVAGPGG